MEGEVIKGISSEILEEGEIGIAEEEMTILGDEMQWEKEEFGTVRSGGSLSDMVYGIEEALILPRDMWKGGPLRQELRAWTISHGYCMG